MLLLLLSDRDRLSRERIKGKTDVLQEETIVGKKTLLILRLLQRILFSPSKEISTNICVAHSYKRKHRYIIFVRVHTRISNTDCSNISQEKK